MSSSSSCALDGVVISCHSLNQNVPKVYRLSWCHREFSFPLQSERLQKFWETLIKARTRLAFRDACIPIFLECGWITVWRESSTAAAVKPPISEITAMEINNRGIVVSRQIGQRSNFPSFLLETTSRRSRFLRMENVKEKSIGSFFRFLSARCFNLGINISRLSRW